MGIFKEFFFFICKFERKVNGVEGEGRGRDEGEKWRERYLGGSDSMSSSLMASSRPAPLRSIFWCL